VLSKVVTRLCEALKLSWLFVENVQTLKSSDENRLCKALNLYKLLVKPRAAFFPEKRIEVAPQNPKKRARLETHSKKES
jgi:hypothetical protein